MSTRFSLFGFSVRPALLSAAAAILTVMLTSATTYATAARGTLVLMEIAPATATNYVVTSESREYDVVSDFVLKRYRSKNPSCKINLQKIFRHGTDDDLFATVKQFAQDDSTVIVGLSRTNFARVAANAAKGSKIQAMSIGAASTQIRDINPNFASIASPWNGQWDLLKKRMLGDGCTAKNTLAIFDATNPISNLFHGIYKQEFGGGEAIHSQTLIDSLNNGALDDRRCVFITLNLSQSEGYLAAVNANPKTLHIYGPGEWNIFDIELDGVLKKISRPSLSIHFPTGWISTPKFEATPFARQVHKELGRYPSPLGIYFHDALILSLEKICNGIDFLKFPAAEIQKMEMLRTYTGISAGGNYLNPMQLLTFTQARGKYADPR